MKTLGKYQIIYDNNVKQIKNLIDHNDYLNIIIPYKDKIYDLQMVKDFKQASILKKELLEMFGDEYFTTESPLF